MENVNDSYPYERHTALSRLVGLPFVLLDHTRPALFPLHGIFRIRLIPHRVTVVVTQPDREDRMITMNGITTSNDLVYAGALYLSESCASDG